MSKIDDRVTYAIGKYFTLQGTIEELKKTMAERERHIRADLLDRVSDRFKFQARKNENDETHVRGFGPVTAPTLETLKRRVIANLVTIEAKQTI